MQNTSSKKTILIIVVLLIIAGAAYFYFSGAPDNASISSLDSPDGQVSDAGVAGQNVLMLLNQINMLTIDTSIFNDPVYKSLVDHTVQVPEQPVGRPNPFAPFPGSSISQTSATNPATNR